MQHAPHPGGCPSRPSHTLPSHRLDPDDEDALRVAGSRANRLDARLGLFSETLPLLATEGMEQGQEEA